MNGYGYGKARVFSTLQSDQSGLETNRSSYSVGAFGAISRTCVA